MFHVKHFQDQTIAALATPLGKSSVAIIRLSGNQTPAIIRKIFRPKKQKTIKINQLVLGCLVFKKQVIDEVMLASFKAPNSYTGEHVAEIQCHGNPQIVRRTLSILFQCGARPADKGEFTKRAFLNGKIDLAKAESIIDIIDAKTYQNARLALNVLAGELSKFVVLIRKKLVDVLSMVEVTIDFEDDVKPLNFRSILPQIDRLISDLKHRVIVSKQHEIMHTGFNVAILGKPNVGKSSLLNSLVGFEKAIVTDLAGTTRDAVEHVLDVSGVPINLIDTAGIRIPKNKVEEIGIKRARAHGQLADLALIVLDNSRPLTKQDLGIIKALKDRPYLLVVNKCDLKPGINLSGLKAKQVIKVSALEGRGLHKLRARLASQLKIVRANGASDRFVFNARQVLMAQRACEGLDNARQAIKKGLPIECLAMDLKQAIISLGEIIGENVSDEVINNIFDRFCVGK